MKLYEVLALEPDLQEKAKEAFATITRLFASGESFIKRIESYRPLLDGEPELQSKETEMAFTVEALLEEFTRVQGDFMNIALTKENTNADTMADLVVDGKLLAAGLPATALLNLEGRLAEIRKLYEAIPTIDPTGKWEDDASTGLRKAGPFTKLRFKKVRRSHVLYEHTPEHPAQVEPYSEDVPAYEVDETIWNSKMTIAEKRARIKRIDKLIQETKAARLRANDHEAQRLRVSDKIFGYIEEGTFTEEPNVVED